MAPTHARVSPEVDATFRRKLELASHRPGTAPNPNSPPKFREMKRGAAPRAADVCDSHPMERNKKDARLWWDLEGRDQVIPL